MGNIHQTTVRSRRRPGRPGLLYDSSNLNEEVNVANKHPQAVQEDKLTVSTAEDDREYVFKVNGVEITIDSGDGATTGSIAEALAEAHNASPMVRQKVMASAENDEVTFTGQSPGVPYDIETDDANLALESVSDATQADPVPFGRVVIRSGRSSDGRMGRLANDNGLDKASVTFEHGETDAGTVTLKIDGDYITATGATAEALATAINAEVPAHTVTATDAGTAVTVEVDTAGDVFELVSFGGDISLDDHTRGDSVERLALGVSRSAYDEEVSRDGQAAYPPNAGVSVLRRGRIWVESPSGGHDDDEVYVQMTGDDAGKVYPTRDAGRINISSLASWYMADAGEGLGVLSCDFR